VGSSIRSDVGGRHIIFVDGECVFCNGLVARIAKLDKEGLFHFAHLQSDLAKRAKEKHGADPEDIDGIYLLVHEDTPAERLLIDGAAGREIWPRLLWFAFPMRLVPIALLDVFYKVFARYRYRLFGKHDTCLVPTPELQKRFLSDPADP
jgi:predicted DCC family thiol-disulfide oxidoreductase YuxK